jgi:hypothetical protein
MSKRSLGRVRRNEGAEHGGARGINSKIVGHESPRWGRSGRQQGGHWIELIAVLAREQPICVVVFCRERPTVEQVEPFARKIVPAAR